MATAKRQLTNPPVQGHRVIDLRDDLVSLEEACAALNVSIATLYRYMATGRLRFQRVNGTRGIGRNDLLRCKDNRELATGCDERGRMQRRAAATSSTRSTKAGRLPSRPEMPSWRGSKRSWTQMERSPRVSATVERSRQERPTSRI